MTEQTIVTGMRLVYERLKLAVEPSGAVGLAAVLTPQWKGMCAPGGELEGCKKIGVVLCGGNADLGVLWQSLSSKS